jgi:15-cis-phytoene synthase
MTGRGHGRGHGIESSREALARGSKSFALAGRLLPRGVRDDAAVVYAFCRRADDLIDDAPADEVPTRLAQLSTELDALAAGRRQTDPVLAAFQEVMFRRQIPRSFIDELFAGFAMDARRPPVVTASLDELMLYAYRVAGTVGLMMCQVLGVSDPRAQRHAAALGMAMQLTNIARDVTEDWQRGRLYLPPALLPPTHRLVPGTPLDPTTAAALSQALPPLLALAEPLYRWGDAGLAAMGMRAAIAIRAARLVYSDIGRVLAARGPDVTRPRAYVPLTRKLWLALKAATTEAFARVRQNLAGRPPATPLPALATPLPRPYLDLPRPLP